MTGLELLAMLTTVPNETLDQEVLFEVRVQTPYEYGEIVAALPAADIGRAKTDYLLTPNGTMTKEEAADQYMEAQIEAALGDIGEEVVKEMKLSSCPLLVNKEQLVIKIEAINLTPPIEPDPEPPFGDDYQRVLGNPAGEVEPGESIEEIYMTRNQLHFIDNALKAWHESKGDSITAEEDNMIATIREQMYM